MKIKTKSKLGGEWANENKQAKNFTCKVLEKMETILFSIPTQEHKFVKFTTPKCKYQQTKSAHAH